ncbi:START domain containing protein [Novymonas esmeraldas]|uniref:START domain containing protein n=1 Tax=Novymonas esmeraldas TaxID=1808958 RepID=A0AAW0F2U8_9TRYP
MEKDEELYAESKGKRYVLMTLPHFRAFRDLALSSDDTWSTHYEDAVLKVESKPPNDASTTLNIIRATRVMEKVPPLVLYNQLHDAKYRATWDTNMLEGFNVAQLDAHNDFGYYAAKFPWPLSNRDFCNMRSWMEFTNGEYIIFNHSEPHPDCPEKKGFIRARSILTGFYVRPMPSGSGTQLVYVTQSDPCGSIPHTVINYAMTKGARMILDKCEKYSEEYPTYAEKTYPKDHVYPWRTPKMDWDSCCLYPEDVTPASDPADDPRPVQQEQEVRSSSGDGGEHSGDAREAPFLSSDAAPAGPALSLAPVAPYRVTDLLSVQQYRSTMQDAMNAVDRSYLREGRVPTTKEYLLRLKYMIEGIRQTTVDV